MTNPIESISSQLSRRTPVTASGETEYWASVALVLGPHQSGVEALFIRRAERLDDPWSGHVALPGGRQEAGDRTLRSTAERETLEEVGLDLSMARYLGQLDDLAPRIRRLPLLAVRPFVYALDQPRPDLVLNHEVAGTFWTPLVTLVQPGVRRIVEVSIDGRSQPVNAFVIGEHVIWGITERILRGFLALGTGPG